MTTGTSSPTRALEAALRRAAEDRREALAGPRAWLAHHALPAVPDPVPPARRVAIGDPQAPLSRFFGLLDGAGLLGEDGRLADGFALWSVGDHLDWGGAAERPRNIEEGTALLAWLAAHPAGRVVLVAGNHDLARTGELVALEDAAMEGAVAEALAIRDGGDPDATREQAFGARYPAFPSSRDAWRDLAAFGSEQCPLLEALLAAGRLRLAAAAADDVLVTHAGITRRELALLGLPECARAPAIEAALARALESALEGRSPGEPLALPGLHRPATAGRPARGIACWNPANPEVVRFAPGDADQVDWFDPRTLPPDLDQVVGHVRDLRCRERLGPWVTTEPPREGLVRGLVSDGREVRYRYGVPPRRSGHARMVFLDGRLATTPIEAVELYDLDRREPFRR